MLVRFFAALACAFALIPAACARDHHAGPGYDPQADAQAVIDAALARAGEENKAALFLFGANWCHDSRGLARALDEEPALTAILSDHYVLARIDIGLRHRNLDQLARFGIDEPFGTPTVVIAAPDETVLNAATVHDWRAADDADTADVAAYLRRHAGAEGFSGAVASVDLAAAAETWPPLAEARAAIAAGLAEGALSDADAERARAYAQGMARSIARLAMGREARDQALAVADSADLAALNLAPSGDLTEAVIARMAEIEMDILARLETQTEETRRAAGEDAAENADEDEGGSAP